LQRRNYTRTITPMQPRMPTSTQKSPEHGRQDGQTAISQASQRPPTRASPPRTLPPRTRSRPP